MSDSSSSSAVEPTTTKKNYMSQHHHHSEEEEYEREEGTEDVFHHQQRSAVGSHNTNVDSHAAAFFEDLHSLNHRQQPQMLVSSIHGHHPDVTSPSSSSSDQHSHPPPPPLQHHPHFPHPHLQQGPSLPHLSSNNSNYHQSGNDSGHNNNSHNNFHVNNPTPSSQGNAGFFFDQQGGGQFGHFEDKDWETLSMNEPFDSFDIHDLAQSSRLDFASLPHIPVETPTFDRHFQLPVSTPSSSTLISTTTSSHLTVTSPHVSLPQQIINIQRTTGNSHAASAPLESPFSFQTAVTLTGCTICGKMSRVVRCIHVQALTAEDCQVLVERGWKRLGKFMYNPTTDLSCCPEYAFRIPVSSFDMSNAQQSLLHSISEYMRCGIVNPLLLSEPMLSAPSFSPSSSSDRSHSVETASRLSTTTGQRSPPPCDSQMTSPHGIHMPATTSTSNSNSITNRYGYKPPPQFSSYPKMPPPRPDFTLARKRSQSVDAASGSHLASSSPSRLLGHKSKVGRNGEPVFASDDAFSTPKKHNASLGQDRKSHKIEVTLVSPEFREEAFALFCLSEMKSKKPPLDSKLLKKEFEEIALVTPLTNEHISTAHIGYGTFHLEYRLDGKLVGVSILDILPRSISAVAFFSDPSYHFLHLEAYSILTEISLGRQLQEKNADIKHYYMGYYSRKSPLSSYKIKYAPSQLLCPTSFQWVWVADVYHKMEGNVPLKLLVPNPPKTKIEEAVLMTLKVLEQNEVIEYQVFERRHGLQYRQRVMDCYRLFGPELISRIIIQV